MGHAHPFVNYTDPRVAGDMRLCMRTHRGQKIDTQSSFLFQKFEGCIEIEAQHAQSMLDRYFPKATVGLHIKSEREFRLKPVQDLLMQGRVYSLDLSGTPVTDVSMLGGVHKLYLSFTPVTDVSMLGGVKSLDLCGTPVTDVSMPGGVCSLDIGGTNVTDVSMLGGGWTPWSSTRALGSLSDF